MSLPRADVRFKLAHEMHEALRVICEAREIDINEFVEALVVAEVRRRLHQASVIADHAQRLGILGIERERAG